MPKNINNLVPRVSLLPFLGAGERRDPGLFSLPLQGREEERPWERGWNINCITIVITLEGIEKMKTETKMTTRQFEEYFFHQRCQKTSTNTVMASRFWLAVYIVQLFDSHFSLVSFSRLKYILARQILHFNPQNALQYPTLIIIRNIPITPKTVYFKSGLQAYMFFVVTKWRRPLLIFCLERKGELSGSI